MIIDGSSGEPVDLKSLKEEVAGVPDVLLSPEMELMRAMQNPPESNEAFDAPTYARLLGEGRHEEAEEMIQREGGPTLQQMQREPLEILRRSSLDVNWIDPEANGCSLLQWASAMGCAALFGPT